MSLRKRYRIVGIEVVGLSAFLIFIIILQLTESHWTSSVEEFGIVYAIIGFTLLLVGLEILSLNRRLPQQ